MKDSNEMSKVVMARCSKKNIDYELDINTYFLNLCLNYPNSFVYAVSSAVTGTWMAATPEILLKTNYSIIETIALAGTMLSNSKGTWGTRK
jgi:isochorismate synthase